jgi:hypothetical protein
VVYAARPVSCMLPIALLTMFSGCVGDGVVGPRPRSTTDVLELNSSTAVITGLGSVQVIRKRQETGQQGTLVIEENNHSSRVRSTAGRATQIERCGSGPNPPGNLRAADTGGVRARRADR